MKKFDWKKNLPTILSCIGVAGAAGVGVSAAVAQHKVEIELDELYLDEEKDIKKESVKTYAKHYWPTVLIFAGTSAAIIGSNELNKKNYKTLMNAYTSLGAGFAAYRGAVIEEYGKEKDDEYVEKVLDVVSDIDCYICNNEQIVNNIPDKLKLFYEPITKQYFRRHERDVIHAEYLLNRDFSIGGCINVSRLCEFLGIDVTEDSNKRGWSMEYGYNWIDISHRKMRKLVNGEPCFEICYTFLPEKDFYDYYNATGMFDDYLISDSVSGDEL